MIRDIHVDDVMKVNVQPAQAKDQGYVDRMVRAGHAKNALTYTENGIVKACLGGQEYWKGRATIWAIIGDVDNWVAFHKSARAIIEAYSEKHNVIRLEMTTEVGFDESERWARMLGFRLESTMTNFGMDGKDHKMWVRLWQ